MASVNKVILVGNLGADPELRYATNGDAVCNIRLATTDSWKDKSTGEKKEHTEWMRVVFYRKLAEIAGQYLRKGSQVYLEGRIRTRKWTDKEGQERYTTEIEATELQMLGKPEGGSPRQDTGSSQPAGNTGSRQGATRGSFYNFEDDIPFRQFAPGAAWRVL